MAMRTTARKSMTAIQFRVGMKLHSLQTSRNESGHDKHMNRGKLILNVTVYTDGKHKYLFFQFPLGSVSGCVGKGHKTQRKAPSAMGCVGASQFQLGALPCTRRPGGSIPG